MWLICITSIDDGVYDRKDAASLRYSVVNWFHGGDGIYGGDTDLYMLFWADWDARMTLRWYPWPTID